jgi:hypothetical protein
MRHATHRCLVVHDQDAGSVPDIREGHVRVDSSQEKRLTSDLPYSPIHSRKVTQVTPRKIARSHGYSNSSRRS